MQSSSFRYVIGRFSLRTQQCRHLITTRVIWGHTAFKSPVHRASQRICLCRRSQWWTGRSELTAVGNSDVLPRSRGDHGGYQDRQPERFTVRSRRPFPLVAWLHGRFTRALKPGQVQWPSSPPSLPGKEIRIPCNAIDDYYHDHFFVPVARVDDALAVLTAIVGDGRGEGVPESWSSCSWTFPFVGLGQSFLWVDALFPYKDVIAWFLFDIVNRVVVFMYEAWGLRPQKEASFARIQYQTTI